MGEEAKVKWGFRIIFLFLEYFILFSGSYFFMYDSVLHWFLLLIMLSGQEQAPAEVKPEAEEKKEEKAEEKKEEKPEEQKEEPKPPLPFVLFVDLHCVGCAKKIERSLMKIRALSLSLSLSSCPREYSSLTALSQLSHYLILCHCCHHLQESRRLWLIWLKTRWL